MTAVAVNNFVAGHHDMLKKKWAEYFKVLQNFIFGVNCLQLGDFVGES